MVYELIVVSKSCSICAAVNIEFYMNAIDAAQFATQLPEEKEKPVISSSRPQIACIHYTALTSKEGTTMNDLKNRTKRQHQIMFTMRQRSIYLRFSIQFISDE